MLVHRLALLVAVSGVFGSFALGACSRTVAPPAPTTANLSGTLRRDNLPLAATRILRDGPPLADGGSGNGESFTNQDGRFLFRDFSTPYSLRVFDARDARSPRTVLSVVGLGKDDPKNVNGVDVTLPFGASEQPRGVWRARVAMHLDADPSAASDPAMRTILVAGGDHVVAATPAPANPTSSVDLAVEWTGPYETSIRVQAVRLVDGAPIRYLASGSTDIGRIHDGQSLDGRIELRPMHSQTVNVEVTAASDLATHVTAWLDFGDDTSSAVLASEIGTTVECPKLGGARVRFVGRAERDGDESSFTLPSLPIPIEDNAVAPTAKLPLVAPIKVSAPAEGASVGADARFTFALPDADPGPRDGGIGAPTAWVHEITFSPIGGGESRLGYVVVTHATEASVPSGRALAVTEFPPHAEAILHDLAGPTGLYEWSVRSHPDLAHVDDWAVERDPLDTRVERIVRTRARRVTFPSAP